jgi:uncharacterized protein YjbJ (UPF0337 family)
MADKERIKGKFNEAAGSVKQGVGTMTGDEQLEAEGKSQEFKGKGQGFVGGVKEKAKELGDTVKGAAEAIKDSNRPNR